MSKQDRIKQLIEGELYNTPNKLRLTEAEDSSKDTFETLDEVRKNLQDAQAALVVNLQSKYQTLYQEQLSALYDQIDVAISSTIELTKTMKTELRA